MARPLRRRRSSIAPWLLALAVSACSTATLPYKPESPPTGSGISADYVLLADRLRVELDTGGYRLEDAQIVRADGTAVRPLTIENPAPSGGGSSVGFGFGLGGGSYSRGSGVGVGTGIGVGVPLGADTRVQGNTLLYFALDQVGPAPWRLFVKAAETAPATIVLPPR
jgi:hypothetical protein